LFSELLNVAAKAATHKSKLGDNFQFILEVIS
jgi:hypothetical protein